MILGKYIRMSIKKYGIIILILVAAFLTMFFYSIYSNYSLNIIYQDQINKQISSLKKKDLLLPGIISVELSEETQILILDEIKESIRKSFLENCKLGRCSEERILSSIENILKVENEKNVIFTNSDRRMINDLLDQLVGKIQQAVENVHAEQNRDIDRLAYLLAIFLAAIGIFGTIFPIVYNWLSTKGFEAEIFILNKKVKKFEKDQILLNTNLEEQKININKSNEKVNELIENQNSIEGRINLVSESQHLLWSLMDLEGMNSMAIMELGNHEFRRILLSKFEVISPMT